MFREQSSCQNTSRQKKYWHQKCTHESKTLVMKTLCQIPKEKTQLRVLFICYTHSKSTRLKGTCMWYYDRTFPIY